MEHIWRDILRHADRMGPQEWFLVSAVMIVVALVALRGFGSRSRY